MAATDTRKFQFWRFFFSLKGRVSRRAFAAFVIPQKLAIWGIDTLIHKSAYHPSITGVSTGTIILGLINFVFLWPKFALCFKRLHDCRLTGNIALILLMPLFVGIWDILLMAQTIKLPANFQFPANLSFYVIWAFAISLCLIPGTKGPNRYGPPPRERQTQAADVF